MSKKSIFFLSLIIGGVILFVVLSYYFVEEQRRYIRIPPINAVPSDAPLIIESQNFDKLLSSLLDDNKIWTELLNIETINNLNKQIIQLDSIIETNNKIADIIEDKSVIISTHITGKKRIEFLFILNIFNVNSEKEAKKALPQLLQNANITERRYDKTIIYSASFDNPELTFNYTFNDGFLITSISPLLVEEAVRQLNSGNMLLDDNMLKEISQTAGKNVPANIYINHKTFPKLVSALLNQRYAETITTFSPFANWSELDLNIKEDAIMLNGFSSSPDETNTYLSVFRRQEPVATQMLSILPSDISAFIILAFEDEDYFRSDFKEYLTSNNKIEQHNIQIRKINKMFGSQ